MEGLFDISRGLIVVGLTMLLVVFILIERQELRDRFIRRGARDWHDRFHAAFADHDIADLDDTQRWTLGRRRC